MFPILMLPARTILENVLVERWGVSHTVNTRPIYKYCIINSLKAGHNYAPVVKLGFLQNGIFKFLLIRYILP